jgi:hypothetical protein
MKFQPHAKNWLCLGVIWRQSFLIIAGKFVDTYKRSGIVMWPGIRLITLGVWATNRKFCLRQPYPGNHKQATQMRNENQPASSHKLRFRSRSHASSHAALAASPSILEHLGVTMHVAVLWLVVDYATTHHPHLTRHDLQSLLPWLVVGVRL